MADSKQQAPTTEYLVYELDGCSFMRLFRTRDLGKVQNYIKGQTKSYVVLDIMYDSSRMFPERIGKDMMNVKTVNANIQTNQNILDGVIGFQKSLFWLDTFYSHDQNAVDAWLSEKTQTTTPYVLFTFPLKDDEIVIDSIRILAARSRDSDLPPPRSRADSVTSGQ